MDIKIVSKIEDANCITHNGKFHCDEVFSTVLLSKILPEVKLYRTSKITNTRANQFIYDVGGGELDHHQLGGNGERENGVKYSSCGLVWKNFGKKILENHTTNEINYIWQIVDRDLIQYIDSVDNGQIPEINTEYKFLHLSSIISSFNTNWDDNKSSDENFVSACNFAEVIFNNILKGIISKVKAKDFVEKAITESKDKIIILEKFLPWKEFLLNSENKKASEIEFVIFPSERGGYNINSVPKQLGSFENRKLFPKEWAGLKDEELQIKTKVKTATFCHNACFLCVAETKEDAIKLAKLAVQDS